MKKRILLLSMSFILFFACQKKQDAKSASDSTTTESTTTNDEAATSTDADDTSSQAEEEPGNKEVKKIRIGVAIYDNTDTFITTVKSGIDKYVKAVNTKGDLQIETIYADGQKQQAIQSDQIINFITQGVDALALNLVDRTAAGPVIEKAKEAGIPVIFFNREPPKSDMEGWDKAFYVGTPPEQSGQIQAKILYDYLKAHPDFDKNGDGMVQYVMLTGEPGHQDAISRTKAIKDFFESADIKGDLVAEDTALWQRVEGQSKMQAFLSAHDNIEAVVANNDDMALGAVEALKAAGYFKDDKFMPVVGIDATAPAKDAVANGLMIGTVINDADAQGKDTIALSVNLVLGRDLKTDVTNLTGQYDWVPYKPYVKQ